MLVPDEDARAEAAVGVEEPWAALCQYLERIFEQQAANRGLRELLIGHRGAALQRLIQMGATPTNVQSVAGELQNSAAVADLAASRENYPHMVEWFRRYAPAPSLIAMNMPQ